MKEKRKKPTAKGGLERGAKGTAELASSKEGRRMFLFLFGSMFWLFFLMPLSCMKLNEVLPGNAIGVFVGFAMYVAWVAFMIILKQKGISITWPTPKKPPKKQPSVRVTITKRETRFIKVTKRDRAK